jgi:hypothetical protein
LALWVGLIAGVIAAAFLNSCRGWQLLASVGFAIFCGGAAMLTGALAGFLFAIPRSIAGSTPTTPPGQPNQPALGRGKYPARSGKHAANTNLEQISDWLTKIIVGVGLVEFRQILRAIDRMGQFLGPMLGESPLGNLLAIVIVLYYALLGFLITYLITRMYLAQALAQADDQLMLDLGDRPASRKGKGVGGPGGGGICVALSLIGQPPDELSLGTSAEENRRLKRNRILNYLYEYEKQGFDKAIAEAKAYLQFYPRDARVWTHLACAYGQKASHIKDQNPKQYRDAPDFQDCKKCALVCIDQVIALEQHGGWIDVLREVWHPAPGDEDNDLEVFKDDPDFEKRLGP